MTLTADRPQQGFGIFSGLDALRLLLISGKGGVGKTTFACGTARRWAMTFPHERILLLSTDPAHSLADVLQVPVSDAPQALPDLPNLEVRALDAATLLQAFKAEHGDHLERLMERGSFVEGQDLRQVWDLSWPGLDELMGLLEIQRVLRSQQADRVVVDMAPSGHTLSLLGMSRFLDQFLEALERFQQKHRYLSKRFSGQYIPDQTDAFLAQMKADLGAGRALLHQAQQTACWLVAIPEVLSLQETRRFIQDLEPLQIACGGVLVNHYQGQAEMLKQFRTLTRTVLVAPHRLAEPIGAAALDMAIKQVVAATCATVRLRSQTETTDLIVWPEKLLPSLPDFIEQGRRLLIIGGKGGVGKTTIAAALGLRLAEDHPKAAIRLVSIDPAHSLGDALEQSLGHTPLTILPNLSAQEISATQVLDQFRQDYLWEIAEMMGGQDSPGPLQIAYGPAAWRQIVDQALPGIDEILSLLTILDLLESNEQRLVILDTAPTGHLLRFLAMPAALDDWLSWIFRLWLKYQTVAGHTDLMGRLRKLRQRLLLAQKKLTDPTYTEFIGVFQNQSVILAETVRLVPQLRQIGLSQRYWVHNRYDPQNPLAAETFPDQTVVRLPELPSTIPCFEQVKGAAKRLI